MAAERATSQREISRTRLRQLKRVGLEWLLGQSRDDLHSDTGMPGVHGSDGCLSLGSEATGLGDLLSLDSSGSLPEYWRRFRLRGGSLDWAPGPLRGRLIAWTVSPTADRRQRGVIGSRLGRRPDLATHFSIGLREFTRRLDPVCDCVLLAKSSPQYRLVARAIRRAQIPSITVDDSAARSWKKWLELLSRCNDQFLAAAVISPQVWTDPTQARLEPAALADRLIAAVSDSLFAPHVRARGVTTRLLEQKSASGGASDCWLGSESDREWFVASLHDASVNVHRVTEELCSRSGRCQPARQASGSLGAGNHLRDIARLLERPTLVHCTRAVAGPWPLESDRQFLDSILATCEPRDALASLKRILDRRLLARSKSGLRGGHRAVCLSAASLRWIRDARVYRPHRMRWDFEPYGLCFSRRALGVLGAKPVVYAEDDRHWRQLSEEQRFLFQLATSNNGAIDWRAEEEWRLPGDLSLTDLDPGDYCAFTKDAQEAARLAPTSPCPVVPLSVLVEHPALSQVLNE
jgi:hypothetical protein